MHVSEYNNQRHWESRPLAPTPAHHDRQRRDGHDRAAGDGSGGRRCGDARRADAGGATDARGAPVGRAAYLEWDAGNEPKLSTRHNVEPGECEQAFFREPFLVVFDEKHSGVEQRWQALGRTLADRRLFLVFTVRGALIRIIAARDMNRRERRTNEKAQASLEENAGL